MNNQRINLPNKNTIKNMTFSDDTTSSKSFDNNLIRPSKKNLTINH